MQELEQAIRERAYHLWVADGYNSGNADAHWLTAQREVLESSMASAALATKPAAKKKAKAAAAKTTAAKTTATKRKSKAA